MATQTGRRRRVGILLTTTNHEPSSGSASGTRTRREESVTGVVVGDRECELTDSIGNVYGMFLNAGDSNYGKMMMKTARDLVCYVQVM